MVNHSNRNRSFWDREKKGAMRIGKLLIQATKELSSIPAHGVREITGQPHDKKPKAGLKKGWFE